VTPADPRPAASVVLVRDARPGAPEPLEVYMIRRKETMKFLGGFYAFPGGRVDSQDSSPEALARCHGLDESGAAALHPGHGDLSPLAFWVTAVRELLEESGVLLVCDHEGRAVRATHPGAKPAVERARKALMAGEAPFAAILAREGEVLAGALRSLALPALALGLAAMAPLARMARAAMREALGSDYVRAARALGLVERTVVVRHALRSALLPVVTMIAVVFGYQLGGVVLVEAVFAWPGLGQYAYNAVANADYPAVQGFILYATTMYLALFLAVDLLCAVLDPRARAA